MRTLSISKTSFAAAFVLGLFAVYCSGQTVAKLPGAKPDRAAQVRSSPAYAEVVLRRTEFESELEALLLDYTEEFPKVKELKFALVRAKAETDRLIAIPADQVERTTTALGKLMVRKIDAEIEHWRLQQSYADGHPDVKRAKRKVEIFEKAIKEILG